MHHPYVNLTSFLLHMHVRAPEIDMSELENLFAAPLPDSNQENHRGKSRLNASLGPKSDKVQLVR